MNETGLDVPWSMIDGGTVALVGVNSDAATHATLAAYPDVIQIPDRTESTTIPKLLAVRDSLLADDLVIPSRLAVEPTGEGLARTIAGILLVNQQKRSRETDMDDYRFEALVEQWQSKPVFTGVCGKIDPAG